MTGNAFLDLAISLTGVAALVGLAFLLGATKTLVLDEASAQERLAFDEPDFRVGEWMIDTGGRSAIALSSDGGEVVVLFVLGDGLASRRFKVGGLPVSFDGRRLRIRLDDLSKPSVDLAVTDAERLRRIADRLGARPSAKIALASSHAVS